MILMVFLSDTHYRNMVMMIMLMLMMRLMIMNDDFAHHGRALLESSFGPSFVQLALTLSSEHAETMENMLRFSVLGGVHITTKCVHLA